VDLRVEQAEVIRPQYRVLVFVGAYGGLRFGELAGPASQPGGLGRRHGRRGENLTEVEGKLHSGPPKTKASRRRVSLPSGVIEELAVHLRAPGRPTDYVARAVHNTVQHLPSPRIRAGERRCRGVCREAGRGDA
jgi:hypothetical protein